MSFSRFQLIGCWLVLALGYGIWQLPALSHAPADAGWIGLNFLLFLAASQLAVVVHELGHAAVGRVMGLDVIELSLGMGPSVATVDLGGSRLSVRAAPVSGFTRVGAQSAGWIRTRRWLAVAGGPLASTGALLLGLHALGHGSVRAFLGELTAHIQHGPAFWQLFALWNGLALASALVPFAGFGFSSDGLQLLQIPFWKAAQANELLTLGARERGQRALDAGNPRAALEQFDAGLQRVAGDVALTLDRSVALGRLGRFEEQVATLRTLRATGELSAALRVRTAHAMAWAIVEGGLPLLDEAEALVTTDALTSLPGASLTSAERLTMGLTVSAVLALAGYEDALPMLEGMLEKFGAREDRARVSALLALAHQRFGDKARAASFWSDAERLDPGSAFVATLRKRAESGGTHARAAGTRRSGRRR